VITEALAALYALAPKCDVCEEHVATRAPDGPQRGGRMCDRADCIDYIRCVRCNATDAVGALDGWYCVWCGGKEYARVPRSATWRDLPHAEALRAANAAHEAIGGAT
jgi:hypothetical protein